MFDIQHPPLPARLLIAACGLTGVAALIVSFAMNPGPLPNTTQHNTTVDGVIAFANQHRTTIHMGA